MRIPGVPRAPKPELRGPTKRGLRYVAGVASRRTSAAAGTSGRAPYSTSMGAACHRFARSPGRALESCGDALRRSPARLGSRVGRRRFCPRFATTPHPSVRGVCKRSTLRASPTVSRGADKLNSPSPKGTQAFTPPVRADFIRPDGTFDIAAHTAERDRRWLALSESERHEHIAGVERDRRDRPEYHAALERMIASTILSPARARSYARHAATSGALPLTGVMMRRRGAGDPWRAGGPLTRANLSALAVYRCARAKRHTVSALRQVARPRARRARRHAARTTRSGADPPAPASHAPALGRHPDDRTGAA